MPPMITMKDRRGRKARLVHSNKLSKTSLSRIVICKIAMSTLALVMTNMITKSRSLQRKRTPTRIQNTSSDRSSSKLYPVKRAQTGSLRMHSVIQVLVRTSRIRFYAKVKNQKRSTI